MSSYGPNIMEDPRCVIAPCFPTFCVEPFIRSTVLLEVISIRARMTAGHPTLKKLSKLLRVGSEAGTGLPVEVHVLEVHFTPR